MKELIAVGQSQVGSAEIKTVDARELHGFLESKQEFSHWIKNRIKKYSFSEGVDFVAIDNSITSPPSIDYHLTLDMAKELSMVERNDKGKQARLYFLECEKQALAPTTKALPQNYKEALLQLVEQVEVNELLQVTIAEQAPKVEALDRLTLADGLLNITNAAKTLQINPNQRLFAYMASHGWIYRRIGGKGWVAYQDRIATGNLVHKVTTVQTSDGREKIVEQVLVTPKGLAKLAGVFSAEARA